MIKGHQTTSRHEILTPHRLPPWVGWPVVAGITPENPKNNRNSPSKTQQPKTENKEHLLLKLTALMGPYTSSRTRKKEKNLPGEGLVAGSDRKSGEEKTADEVLLGSKQRGCLDLAALAGDFASRREAAGLRRRWDCHRRGGRRSWLWQPLMATDVQHMRRRRLPAMVVLRQQDAGVREVAGRQESMAGGLVGCVAAACRVSAF